MAQSDITGGINGVDCKNAVAGFKNAYVVNFDDYNFTKESDSILGHVITGLPATDFEAYQFPLKNTGNTYNEPSNSQRDAGTTAFNGTLNLVFTKVEALKLFQIKQMVWGRPIVFLETNGGDIIAVGTERGVEFNNTTNIEGAIDGVNAFQLVGTTQESNPAYFLTDTAITELKSAVIPFAPK